MTPTTVSDDQLPKEPERVIDGPWGYACVEDGQVFIPAIAATPEWGLSRVLAHLHEQTGALTFVFTAVLDPDALKSRLRHITREWDEYVPYMDDYSHCIEIAYVPLSNDDVEAARAAETE